MSADFVEWDAQSCEVGGVDWPFLHAAGDVEDAGERTRTAGVGEEREEVLGYADTVVVDGCHEVMEAFGGYWVESARRKDCK